MTPRQQSCEGAAERVKEIVSPGGSLPHFTSHHSLQSFLQSHKYILLKLLHIPSALSKRCISEKYFEMKRANTQKEKSPLHASHLTQKEQGTWGHAAIHTHQCCNQKNPFTQFDHFIPKESELHGNRIKRWKLKEHLLASRKLKGLKTEQQSHYSKKHEVKLLGQKAATKIKKDESNSLELWQDFIQAKEERHFHLTRITKILID